MTFTNENDAVWYIFHSLRRLRDVERGFDEDSRDVSPTTRLLAAANLPAQKREYAVVTGSKGKGSTAAITAKLLEHLGHTVGLMTSPHLVTWRERIRLNGRAIPEADFVRIVNQLEPLIDSIESMMGPDQYFSPQGIFLAVALQWFDEQDANAAVLEVGRGGRFDDIAVVPNRLSLFAPIMMEHAKYLGPTLERIAWHKAGIIKPYSYAYSVPQAPEVLDVLQTEADGKGATFHWLAEQDMGEYLSDTEHGIRMRLGRYGEVELSLAGRYQVSNATLAVQGAGNMHGRLAGIDHGSPEYVDAIRAGLADVRWPGRFQKLQENPNVFVDGAINAESAASLAASLRERLTHPLVSIIAVPDDKDYAGVYRELGGLSDAVILTETARNRILHFLPPDEALKAAREHNSTVSYAPALDEAVDAALAHVGTGGTVLIAGTLSIVADTMARWGKNYEQI